MVGNGIRLLAAAADWYEYDHDKMMQTLEYKVKRHRVRPRRLNGYNIFSKQRSLERTENKTFGSTIEFLDFALDEDVFEKKRIHRKKALHASDGDGGAFTLKSFTAETSNAYKKLPDKQKKVYKQIAAYISMPPYQRDKQSYHDLVGEIEKLEGPIHHR